MYQSSHNVRQGDTLSRSKQIFKVENQNYKLEIPEFPEKTSCRKHCKNYVYQVSMQSDDLSHESKLKN